MPRVPTLDGPQVQNRPATPAFQQTPDLSAFGDASKKTMQAGEALAQAANATNELVEAEARLIARQDVTARVRTANELQRQLEQDYLAEAQGGDNFSTPESVAKFRALARERAQKAVQEHGGRRPDSALIAEQMVSEVVGLFEQRAVAAGVEASKALLDRQATGKVSSWSAMVSDDPSTLADIQAEIGRHFELNYAPGATPEQTEAARTAALSTVAKEAVGHFLTLGAWDDAQKVMDSPLVKPYLDADSARSMRLNIKAGQIEGTKKQAAVTAELELYKSLGINVAGNPQLAAAIISKVSLPASSKREKTLQEKADEVNGALADAGMEPMDRNQMLQLADITVPDAEGPTNFTTGRSRGVVAQNAPAIIADTATPGQLIDTLVGIAAIASPDELSGIPGVLGPVEQAVLEHLGIDPADLRGADTTKINQIALQAAGVAAPAADPVIAPAAPPVSAAAPAAAADPSRPPSVFNPPAEGAPAVAAPASEASPAAAAPAQGEQPAQGEAQPEQEVAKLKETAAAVSSQLSDVGSRALQLRPGESPAPLLQEYSAEPISIYEVADLVTGPFSSLGARAYGTTVIGEIITAPMMAQYRAHLNGFVGVALATLQQTDRYGDAERKDLSTRFKSLESAFFGNPAEFQSTLIGLDRMLLGKQEFIQQQMADPRAGNKESRAKMQEQFQEIEWLRQSMGTPLGAPQIGSPQQLADMVEKGEVTVGDWVIYGPVGKPVRLKRIPSPEEIKTLRGGE